MDLNLAKQSYNISCDRIRQLNDKYKTENDLFINKQFNCSNIMNIDDHDINNDKKYIKYINNLYITNHVFINQLNLMILNGHLFLIMI